MQKKGFVSVGVRPENTPSVVSTDRDLKQTGAKGAVSSRCSHRSWSAALRLSPYAVRHSDSSRSVSSSPQPP